LDQPPDFLERRPQGIGRLEERMRCFERSCEKHNAPCVLRNPLQSGSNSGRRGGPNQEHGLHTFEACIKGLRKSEVSANHLDLLWQSSRAWVARQCADLRARGHQARDNLAADSARTSNDKHTIHPRSFYSCQTPAHSFYMLVVFAFAPV